MRYSSLPCTKCGGGTFSLPKMKIITPYTFSQDKYCPKCGEALVKNCMVCHGTGKKSFLPYFYGDKYCSECGRELEPPDDTCSACDGSGEIYSNHHFCIHK